MQTPSDRVSRAGERSAFPISHDIRTPVDVHSRAIVDDPFGPDTVDLQN